MDIGSSVAQAPVQATLASAALPTLPARACVDLTCAFLHDDGGDAHSLAPLAARLAIAGAVGLQAARPANPLSSDNRRLSAYRGFRWWVGGTAPDPASYGDSLAQIVAWTEEYRATAPRSLVLIGRGHGAAMALAAAAVAGDLLAGVVALECGWNVPAGWQPRIAAVPPPVLLACDRPGDARPLAEAGAAVEVVDREQTDPGSVQRWLAALAPTSVSR